MFGYVVPVKKELRQQDYVLYRSFYCGICKSIGKNFGQFPRFTTTYDITFLSLLVHDLLNQDVEFSEEKCIGNPFKDKVVIRDNELLKRLSAANIILSYYKFEDNVIDKEGRGRRLIKSIMTKAYKKAAAFMPNVDTIVNTQYQALRAAERDNAVGIDRICDHFAKMMALIIDEIMGEKQSETITKLCYNVGKFVYLIDALDDIDEDYKKKNYNIFLLTYGNYISRTQFMADNADNLNFIFASTVNRVISCFNDLIFTQSYTLLRNIIHQGLRSKVEEVMKSEKKLDNPRI